MSPLSHCAVFWIRFKVNTKLSWRCFWKALKPVASTLLSSRGEERRKEPTKYRMRNEKRGQSCLMDFSLNDCWCQLAKKPILLYSETRKWCTPLIFCTDEKCCIFPADSDTAAVEISHCDFFVNPSLAIICQKNKNTSPNNKWAQKCEIYCRQMFVILWIVLASRAFKSVLWDERLTPQRTSERPWNFTLPGWWFVFVPWFSVCRL